MIGIDLRTLALFRIVLGLVLLWCVLSCFRDLTAFWTDSGVMPRAWMIESDSRWRLSLYLINGQTWFVATRSEEHTSELQSLMRTSYAVFFLKKKKQK